MSAGRHPHPLPPFVLPPGGAQAAILADGRLHLNHGPIDAVVEVDAPAPLRQEALTAVVAAFPDVLPGLVAELPLLRRPIAEGSAGPQPRGPVARRMAAACAPWADRFVTPMAAVAGAVADHLMAALLADGRAAGIARAYVNDGGDIALHLAPGTAWRCGLVGDPRAAGPDGATTIAADWPVRGVATSGRHGRSLSRGIADAVTVLAADAAAADAAATMIANAVDLDHPGILRAPARALDPDSDLGDLMATLDAPRLSAAEIDQALRAGVAEAERARARGLIWAALLRLQGRCAAVGPPDACLTAAGEAASADRPQAREDGR